MSFKSKCCNKDADIIAIYERAQYGSCEVEINKSGEYTIFDEHIYSHDCGKSNYDIDKLIDRENNA